MKYQDLISSAAAWKLQLDQIHSRGQKLAEKLIKRERAAAEKTAAHKAARKEHDRELLFHIARAFDDLNNFSRPGRAHDSWHIGDGCAGDSVWYKYKGSGRLMKWEPGSNGIKRDAEQNLLLSNTIGRTWALPPIPARLARAAALDEPHPVGYFAVPVRGQVGVFACMNVSPLTWSWAAVGFCVRGRRVPECVARGTTTLADIEREENAETRQIMIERFGAERYVRESGARELDHSDLGTLYDLHGARWVKVINATPEPDGSYKDYWLRVPPNIDTAARAVAWSFGLKIEEYAPLVES